jgi:hypothetical protein
MKRNNKGFRQSLLDAVARKPKNEIPVQKCPAKYGRTKVAGLWPDPEKVDELKVEFCPIMSDLLPISGQVISLAFGRLKGVFFVGY